jgi:ubiquinone/menaquinone biosynthesis C-methylase UbiE
MAKDLFSKQAAVYVKYRPQYPAELFDYILSFVPQKDQVWDCATGNGQAAVELAKHCKKVFATDISEKQILQAVHRDNIEYSIAHAESSGLPANSCDLITVAQAYHWLNFEAFKEEAMRVGKKNAVVAVWGYSLVVCEDAAINNILGVYYRETVGPYWDKERRYVDDHYKTVLFPYQELPSREFKIDVAWDKETFIGYLNTWSCIQHFINANQFDPVQEFAKEVGKVWQDGVTKKFYFPLFLRIGTL